MAPASALLQVCAGWVCPGPACAWLDVNSWPLPSGANCPPGVTTKNVPRVMECPRGHVHPGSGSLLLGPEQGVRVRQPPVTLPPHNALPGDPATGRAEVKAIPGPVTAFGGGRGVNLKGSPGPHWGRTWVGAGFGERSDFSSRPRPTALLRAQREHDQLPTLVEGDKHVTGTFGAALSDTKLPGSAWTIWK